jgi:hypothetical protein
VRPHAGGVAQGEQGGGDGVRGGGAVGAQDAVAVDVDTTDPEHVAELRGVDDVDLEEDDVGASGDGVHPALRALLGRVLGRVAGLPPVGDDVQRAVVRQGVADEPPGGLVELQVVGPQLRRPGHARDE